MGKNKETYCISKRVGQYNCNCNKCRMINGKNVNKETEKLAYYESKIYQVNGSESIREIVSKYINSYNLQFEISNEIWNKMKRHILDI